MSLWWGRHCLCKAETMLSFDPPLQVQSGPQWHSCPSSTLAQTGHPGRRAGSLLETLICNEHEERFTSACLQVAALYENCLKLATENKITSRNTWGLPLIDHISDLVADGKVQSISERSSCCSAVHAPQAPRLELEWGCRSRGAWSTFKGQV